MSAWRWATLALLVGLVVAVGWIVVDRIQDDAREREIERLSDQVRALKEFR